MIASFFDGRARIRAAALKHPQHMDMALMFVRMQQGVLRVTPNSRVGSILVEYDPALLSREAVAQALESFAERFPPERNTPFLRARKDSGALFCALGLTVAALVLRDKRLHGLCATVFTALSALHAAARR